MMHKHNSKRKIKNEPPFDLHYNLDPKEREYSALNDPHANYFFASKVAKERLKNLKLQLKRERKYKSPAKRQIIRSIDQKIKGEFPSIRLPHIQNNNDDASVSKDHRKMSHPIPKVQLSQRNKDLSHKSSLKHFSRAQAYELQTPVAEGLKTSQNTKLRKSSKKSKAKVLKKDKQKVNHQDFLIFLNKKKEAVIVLREEPSG